MNPNNKKQNTTFMLTELKASIQSTEPYYNVLRIGAHIFVIRSLFVIAQVKIISERKFSVKPMNLFGLLNIYLMLGKYHLHYKTLEDDVIYALRENFGNRNVSIVLG